MDKNSAFAVSFIPVMSFNTLLLVSGFDVYFGRHFKTCHCVLIVLFSECKWINNWLLILVHFVCWTYNCFLLIMTFCFWMAWSRSNVLHVSCDGLSVLCDVTIAMVFVAKGILNRPAIVWSIKYWKHKFSLLKHCFPTVEFNVHHTFTRERTFREIY